IEIGHPVIGPVDRSVLAGNGRSRQAASGGVLEESGEGLGLDAGQIGFDLIEGDVDEVRRLEEILRRESRGNERMDELLLTIGASQVSLLHRRLVMHRNLFALRTDLMAAGLAETNEPFGFRAIDVVMAFREVYVQVCP